MSMLEKTCRSFITFSFPLSFRQNHHQAVGWVQDVAVYKATLNVATSDRVSWLNYV